MLGVTHGTRYDGSHGARLSVLAIIDAALIIGTLGAGSAATAARRGVATGARAGTGMLDDAARALIRCANSFSEDTVVATATGLLAISTLTSGSMVLAYNEATDTVDLYPVTQVHEHLDPVIILLTIDDNLTDDHPGLIIETTPEHPFYVAGTWVNAEDLTVGTVLSSFDGEQGILPRGTITSTARVEQEQMMYDLTVYTAHTFFVGDGQYLVHNTAPCFSIDDLVKSAAQLKGNDLTVAGHSLTKHGAGSRPGNQLFPSATGNATQINTQAQAIVEDILTDPNVMVKQNYRGRFGSTVEYISPDGRGIVFDSKGQFLFFREGF